MSDGEVLPDLRALIEGSVVQVTGDGGYDTADCYATIAEAGASAVVPPRKGARIWQHGNSGEEPLDRDANLRRIRKVGRKRWKEESDYHRRSLVETAFFRLKTIFGPGLSARCLEGQATEAAIRCLALNRMTSLGMPDSSRG